MERLVVADLHSPLFDETNESLKVSESFRNFIKGEFAFPSCGLARGLWFASDPRSPFCGWS